jgi:hypothetical protein
MKLLILYAVAAGVISGQAMVETNRFKYVLTPKHGSWLNIVETLFGKMTRTFLWNIRVQSREELRDRILKGIAEINTAPVVHRWKKFEALAVDLYMFYRNDILVIAKDT